MLTFKLYFNSEVLRITKFIKIQINFIEKLKYNPKQVNLKSIIPENEELSFLFPNEYNDLREVLTLQIYDIKEILCEKIRAILTRESIKARDLVDIYFILEKERINLKDLDLEKQIIEKIKFAINLYEKYRTNLQINSKLITTEDFFDLNDVQPLLIKEINLEHFNDFVRNIKDFLLTKILPKLSS